MDIEGRKLSEIEKNFPELRNTFLGWKALLSASNWKKTYVKDITVQFQYARSKEKLWEEGHRTAHL